MSRSEKMGSLDLESHPHSSNANMIEEQEADGYLSDSSDAGSLISIGGISNFSRATSVAPSEADNEDLLRDEFVDSDSDSDYQDIDSDVSEDDVGLAEEDKPFCFDNLGTLYSDLEKEFKMGIDHDDLANYMKTIEKQRMNIKLEGMKNKMKERQKVLALKLAEKVRGKLLDRKEVHRMNEALRMRYLRGAEVTNSLTIIDNKEFLKLFKSSNYTVPFLINVEKSMDYFSKKLESPIRNAEVHTPVSEREINVSNPPVRREIQTSLDSSKNADKQRAKGSAGSFSSLREANPLDSLKKSRAVNQSFDRRVSSGISLSTMKNSNFKSPPSSPLPTNHLSSSSNMSNVLSALRPGHNAIIKTPTTTFRVSLPNSKPKAQSQSLKRLGLPITFGNKTTPITLTSKQKQPIRVQPRLPLSSSQAGTGLSQKPKSHVTKAINRSFTTVPPIPTRFSPIPSNSTYQNDQDFAPKIVSVTSQATNSPRVNALQPNVKETITKRVASKLASSFGLYTMRRIGTAGATSKSQGQVGQINNKTVCRPGTATGQTYDQLLRSTRPILPKPTALSSSGVSISAVNSSITTTPRSNSNGPANSIDKVKNGPASIIISSPINTSPLNTSGIILPVPAQTLANFIASSNLSTQGLASTITLPRSTTIIESDANNTNSNLGDDSEGEFLLGL